MLSCATAVLAGVLTLLAAQPHVVWTVAAIVWLSSLIGVAPVAWFGPRGVMATLYAYFGGAAVRIVLCLAAVVLLIKIGAMPAGAVVMTLMVLYLALLAIEVWQVLHFIRTNDLPTGKEARAS